MKTKKLESIIIEEINDIVRLDIKSIQHNSNLIYDLGFDSLDVIELMMALEKRFNIAINDEVINKDLTVQNVIDKVEELVNAKNGIYQASDEIYVPSKEEIEEREKFNKEKKAWYTFPLTFWELVEKLNWKENCLKENCTKELREKFYQLCEGNTYVMDYFNKYRNSLRHVLQCTLDEYQLKTYGDRCASEFFKYGDDSWDDMANHIIGMGKETYFAILNDPKLAAKHTEDFVESFAYCFHYDIK